MEVESSLAATTENTNETIPTCTANDSSEVPESSLGRSQVLTALAEIGSIQEQENQQPELSDAISKKMKVCFYRFVGQQGFGPVVKLKPSMHKVQEKGRELMEDKISPLFSIHGRESLTYVQFLFLLFFVVKLSVIDLGLSSHMERNTVDFVSLGLLVFYLFVSIVDNWTIIFIYRCGILCTPCRRQMSGVEEDTADDIDCGSRCSSLLKSKYADVFHIMLNEVIVYTTLICTMFQLILNIKQGPFSGYRAIFFIVSFIVAVLWKIMTTYGLSIILIVKAIVSLRRIRKDGPVSSSANWFHAHVVFYVFGQIVSQIAMIVLIGVKMEYENRDFDMGSTIQINGFLWYMLFGGVTIPLAGVFVFVIPTFYSIQEYSIGYFLDYVHSSVSIGNSEQSEQSVPLENINIVQKIETEFNKIHNLSVFRKYAYVFFSPLLVALSIVYTLLIFAFLGSYLLEPNPTVPGQFDVLNSGAVGWTIFFAIFGTLVGLPHLLVLFIGVVWIVIIGFILLLFFVLLILAFACCMCFLAGNDSGRHCAESDCCHRRRRQDSE